MANIVDPRSAGVYGYEKAPAQAAEAFSPSKMGIIGWTEKGESNVPVLVRSYEEFERLLGGLNTRGLVAISVQAFFDTGGEACWVVRVVPNDAVKASVDIDGPAKWTFTAKGAGAYGNDLQIRVLGNRNFFDPNTNTYTRYDVQVLEPAEFNPAFQQASETFEAVQFTDPNGADYILNEFTDERTASTLVDLTIGLGGDPDAFTPLVVTGESLGTAGGTAFTHTAASVPVREGTVQITAEKTPVSNENLGIGDGLVQMDLSTLTAISDTPIKPGSLNLQYNQGTGPAQTITDDGAGNLTGDVDPGGTIDYDTGVLTGTSSVIALAGGADDFFASYTPLMVVTDNGLGGLVGVDLDPAGNNSIDYDTGAIDVTFATATAGADPFVDYVKLTKEQIYSLINGANGTAVTSAEIADASLEANGLGIFAFDSVDEPLNMVVPDFEGSTVVHADLVSYAEAKAANPTEADRFLVLAAANGMTVPEVIQYVLVTQAFDTKVAGFYYPNVRFIDQSTDTVVTLPASPFAAGVMSKTANNKNIGKAPAGTVDGALDAPKILGLERDLKRSEMDDLYDSRINPLIDTTATGRVVWGARTLSREKRWRYTNARLLHNFLRHRIRFLLQAFVFENNGPALWLRINQTLKGDLDSLFRQGYFAGTTAAEAFFVQVDGRNNSASSSRVNIKVAFAPNTPAEFIVFTLEQPVGVSLAA